MLAIWVLSFLLCINIFLLHFEKLIRIYYWTYRSLKKPKFKIGEFVMIGFEEHEITIIATSGKPYVYFCIPLYRKNNCFGQYYHESLIKKKTGLLKELE